MQKYGIREAQLAEIADSGEVSIYDSTGRELSTDEVSRLIKHAYNEAMTFFKQEYIKAGGSIFFTGTPSFNQIVSSKAAEAAPLKAVRRFSFSQAEFEAAFAKILPDFFACYQESQCQTQKVVPDAPFKENDLENAEPVTNKVSVNVPSHLWAGKRAEAAFESLKGDFAKEVIAYILVEKLNVTLAKTGRILAENEVLENKSYRNRVKALLETAKKNYIFTFDE